MKILKFTVAILVCISLIRTINEAPPISLINVIEQVQSVNFEIINVDNINFMYETLQEFKEMTQTNKWENDTGVKETLEHIKNVLVYGIMSFCQGVLLLARAAAEIIINGLKAIIGIIKTMLYICGFIR